MKKAAASDSENLFGLTDLIAGSRVPVSRMIHLLLLRNQAIVRALRKSEVEDPMSPLTEPYQKSFAAFDKSIRGLVAEQTKRALAMATIAKTMAGEMTSEEANKALDDIVHQRIAIMSPQTLRQLASLAEKGGDVVNLEIIKNT